MNKHVSHFLSKVSKEIKYKGILKDILDELQCHIDEMIDNYIVDGLCEEEASKKAVEQMGDPTDIGQRLNKIHKPVTEWSILFFITAMIFIGGFTLFSLANDEAAFINFSGFMKSYLIYIFTGIIVFMTCYYLDYTRMQKYSGHTFIGTTVFLMIATKIGRTVAGVPYISIGGISFSAVSIALPLFLISFSGLANRWVRGSIKDMLKLIGVGILTISIFTAHPSIVGVILITIGLLAIITIAIMNRQFKGNKKRYLFSIYGGGSVGVLFILRNILQRGGYRAHRLFVFLNPHNDPMGAGYIHIVLQDILLNAKLFGKSNELYFTYEGVERMLLPEANTDFIFTYMVSSFGWFVGIITVMIIILAIIRMYLIIGKVKHQYGKYLSCAIVSTFALQALANILMNIGLFPIIGVSLPFISYGGTNFVMNMALMGLLLGIYRRKDLIVAEEEYIIL